MKYVLAYKTLTLEDGELPSCTLEHLSVSIFYVQLPTLDLF